MTCGEYDEGSPGVNYPGGRIPFAAKDGRVAVAVRDSLVDADVRT